MLVPLQNIVMPNSCLAIDQWTESDQMTTMEWVFGTGYAIVGILSLIGNSTVIFIVACKKEMQTVTNALIANLAVSDLSITLTSLWITPAYVFNKFDWVFGPFMCYAYNIVSGMSIIISTFTLTAIAIDRYLLVIHPFSSLSLRPRFLFCGVAIGIIWTSASVMVAPTVYHLKHERKNVCREITACMETGWNKEAKLCYALLILILRSVIPFAIIAVCYTKITLRLKEMNERLKGRKRSSFRQEYDNYRKTRGLQRILIAMVVLFVVCSSPLDLINLLVDLEELLQENAIVWTGYVWVRLLAHFIHMTGTLWNPILYAYGNENFKKEINKRLSIGGTTAHMIERHTVHKSNEPVYSSSPQNARSSTGPQYELSEMQNMLKKNQMPSSSSIHL